MSQDNLCVEGETLTRFQFLVQTSVKLAAAQVSRGYTDLDLSTGEALKMAKTLWRLLCEEFQDNHIEENKEEEPNAAGDTIDYITPDTASCSEIGDSLGGVSARLIAMTARRLCLEPAGIVVWRLKDGSKKEAKSYDLSGWRLIKNSLINKGRIHLHTYLPPSRFDDDGDE